MQPRLLTAFCLAFQALIAGQQHSIVQVSPPGATFGPAEVSVAINPLRPNNIIAVSLTALGTSVAYVSDDGGMSWRLVSNINTSRRYQSDDAVAFDSNGHAYHSFISFFGLYDPPGSPRQSNGVYVMASRDDGATWEAPVAVVEHPDAVAPFEDKPYLAVDNSPQSPFRGNIYISWTRFDEYQGDAPDCGSHIYLSRSTDGGHSFSAPLRVSDLPGDCADSDGTLEGAVPAVGPQGELYVAWSGPQGLILDRSDDGGGSFGVDRFVTFNPGGWDLPIPGLTRHNGLPVTAVDVSDGPHRGRLYVNWVDERFGDTDVFVIHSSDGGTTWSQFVRVNDDVVGNGRSQFFSWMAVDPLDGAVNLIFYDRRDTQGTASGLTLARSTDGGSSFANHGLSLPSFQCDTTLFFGDYSAIAARAGRVVPVFTHCPSSGQLAISAALFDFASNTTPQLTPLDSPDDFDSETAILFDFEGFLDTSMPMELLSRWGVRFSSSTNADLNVLFRAGLLGVGANTFLDLSRQPGKPLVSPLVIDFEHPLKRVGFNVLRSVASGTTIEVVVFDGQGHELGRFETLPESFFGVEAAEGVAISKVTVRTSDEISLLIDDLRIEYATPPSFQICLAQVGNGIADDFRLRTIVAVANPWNFPVEASLVFRDDLGQELPLEIGGATASEFPIVLPGFGSLSLQTEGDDFAVGSACLQTPAPLDATATFQLLSLQGAVLSEAGVGSSTGQQLMVAHLTQSSSGLGSGLAIANPADESVRLVLSIRRQEPESDLSRFLELPPGGHKAFFLDEFFPELNPDFEGPILIRSPLPVAIAALRTGDGKVLSSLPVSGTSR